MTLRGGRIPHCAGAPAVGGRPSGPDPPDVPPVRADSAAPLHGSAPGGSARCCPGLGPGSPRRPPAWESCLRFRGKHRVPIRVTCGRAMRGRFLPAIVRAFGRWGVLGVVLAAPWQSWAGTRPLEQCKARVRSEPRALAGYICFLVNQREGVGEALRFLDERMRVDPENPRPHLYAGVLRSLAGQRVDPKEFRLAIDGFAREHEVAGEVYASASLLSNLCSVQMHCRDDAPALVRRTQELARESGRVDLQQVAEIWTMRVAFVLD